MRKLMNEEVVSNKNTKIVSDHVTVSTNREVAVKMKETVEKFNMAHGSHNQHSSSKEY